MSASLENKASNRQTNLSGTGTLKLEQQLSAERNRSRPTNNLPERYAVKKNNGDRVLICLEAPNLNVHIEAGLSISGSVARKSPGGTIFLDGVAQCEPFMDHERQVYNLDHHEGCVRAFTLSACEQTLVMYMKGLDLQAREWNVFANEPDLDTILATIRRVHETLHAEGTRRITSAIKIGTRTDKDASLAGKIFPTGG